MKNDQIKICCVADLHGYFPEIPDCDLLLMGGDYCPRSKRQYLWFQEEFKPYLNNIAQRGIFTVGVAGNHDWGFQREMGLMPSMTWTYLQDSEIKLFNRRIYGTPWQPTFYNWAFNLDEPELKKKWDLIPEGIDILLLHGPPRGFGDFSPYGKEHTGSPSLTNKIYEIKPKLVVGGHIHSGYGIYDMGEGITYIGASVVNEAYQLVNQPIVIEL